MQLAAVSISFALAKPSWQISTVALELFVSLTGTIANAALDDCGAGNAAPP
jgi:hypothetical protein